MGAADTEQFGQRVVRQLPEGGEFTDGVMDGDAAVLRARRQIDRIELGELEECLA